MPSDTVQNHIHLDFPENLSGAPENAPVMKFIALERSPEYEVFASFSRSWNGTPYFGSIADSQGNPRVFLNYRYVLRVKQNELSALKSMLLQHLLLIDHEHCPDGQDHTSYILPVRFMGMGYVKNFDPLLKVQEVEIQLQEEII